MYEKISVEEAYEYNRAYAMPKCDICAQRTPSNRLHMMERFQDDTTLLVCSRCMSQLHAEGKELTEKDE